MFEHLSTAWKYNRGTLLIVIGGVAGTLMCGIWYFQLLPNIEFTPQTTVSATLPTQFSLLVVTIRGPRHLPDNLGEEQLPKGYFQLFSAAGTLADRGTPHLSREFILDGEDIVALAIDDMQPGTYSALAFIDTNFNGQLDFNDQGQAIEPFRLSLPSDATADSLNLQDAALELSPGQKVFLNIDFQELIPDPTSPK